MSETRWEVVEEVGGTLQAELLRGLLEAQGVPVVLSQEGAGQYAYPVTMGDLGRVQIIVPVSLMERARQVLDDYYAGVFETDDGSNLDENQDSADAASG